MLKNVLTTCKIDDSPFISKAQTITKDLLFIDNKLFIKLAAILQTLLFPSTS
jgi:hypothetical protein